LKYNTMEQLVEHQRQGNLAGWKSHDQMRQEFFGYIPAAAARGRFQALFVNQSGQPHPALRFNGPSFAVDRDGRVIACTESGEEQVLVVTLSQAATGPARSGGRSGR